MCPFPPAKAGGRSVPSTGRTIRHRDLAGETFLKERPMAGPAARTKIHPGCRSPGGIAAGAWCGAVFLMWSIKIAAGDIMPAAIGIFSGFPVKYWALFSKLLKYGDLPHILFSPLQQRPLCPHSKRNITASYGEQLHIGLQMKNIHHLLCQDDPARLRYVYPAVGPPLIFDKPPTVRRIVQ